MGIQMRINTENVDIPSEYFEPYIYKGKLRIDDENNGDNDEDNINIYDNKNSFFRWFINSI